jgi:hypothetical protein
MASYKVTADVARNRLEVMIDGRPTAEEVAAGQRDCLAGIAKMRPGFVAAINLGTMSVALQSDLAGLALVQAALVAARPGKLGTLVAAGIGKAQIERVGKASGVDETVRRFTDEKEWRAFVGS